MAKEQTTTNNAVVFPKKVDRIRIDNYARYDQLQDGNHFDAFNVVLENELNQRWGHLRYIVANFAGLASKVMADMLFSEPVKYKFKDKTAQAFADALVFENKLHVQCYESALTNSARGDALFKLRIGKRNPNDAKPSVIIEDVSPYSYHPELNPNNMRQDPAKKVLAWPVEIGNKWYLRKEIHEAGQITNELWQYNKNTQVVGAKEDWNTHKEHFGNVDEIESTKINRSLIVHIPNWRKGTQYFGTSDYHDLESLFFALNNRLTKIDNILDKHSDPILAVPEGVLDEDGNVRKEKLGLFEVPENTGQGGINKPEYIVWNANLDSAFQEVDKFIELLFMFAEISPATMGMDKNGQAESGRALKMKLLRTIAKKKRKQLYYDQGLKEVLTVAQELAKAWGITATGHDFTEVKAPTKIETPDIEWSDGLINDTREMAEEEQIRLNSGTTTKADAIMRLDGVDEQTARKKAKEIDDETGLDLPLTEKPTDDEMMGNKKPQMMEA